MKSQQCPRCKNQCSVSKQNVELGTLIECQCGRKFEYLPKLDELIDEWTKKESKSSSKNNSESKGEFHFAYLSAPRFVSWKLHLSLLGISLIVSYFLDLSMITTLFLGCLIFTSFCWKNKKAKKKINENSIGYFFFDKCLEFSVCLTVVVTFYTILAWVVDGTSNTTTLARLESLEWFINETRKIIYEYLKFKPWTAALIIFGLIIIDLLISYYLTRKKRDEESETISEETEEPQSNLASHYKTYHTWSKRVYIVMVLLCSFTFFGNVALGERVAHLRLNIDSIRSGYAKLKEETEESLMASVQQKVYERVKQSIFSDSKDTDIKNNFNYPTILNIRLDDLRKSSEILEKYGFSNKDVKETLNYYEIQKQQTVNIPENEPIKYGEPKSNINVEKTSIPTPNPETTVESVNKSLSELEKTKTIRSRTVSLLKLDGTKELFVQFPKSLTDVTKSSIFKNIFKSHPVLEPIVDVFVGTLDKYVEHKVKESTDVVADALLESPEKAKEVLEKEATKIANSVEIKKDEVAQGKIRKFFTEIKLRLARINFLAKSLSSQIDSKCCYCVVTKNGREISKTLMGCDSGCHDGTYKEQCEGVQSKWDNLLNNGLKMP